MILFSYINFNSSISIFAWSLTDVFEGINGNITSPAGYNDQAGGYYTGGGTSIRTKSTHISPMNFTPPSIQTGCGGIDLSMGSFSFISGNEIVNIAKNVGKQTISYGFHLGLKTLSPQIESLLTDLRNLAMELNQFAVEDCQAAQGIWGAVLPKNSAMHNELCKEVEGQGAGKDYFGARSKCQDKGEQERAIKAVESKSDLLLSEYNLVSKAVEKLKLSKDFQNHALSAIGTIIQKKDSKGNFKRKIYDSLFLNEEDFTAHIKGGQSSLYECSSDSCLDMNLNKNHKVTFDNSYQGKIVKKLNGISQSIKNNEGLNEDQKNLITSTGELLPIFEYMSIEHMTGISILDKSSDLLGTYMFIVHISNIIKEVRESLHEIQSNQLNDDDIKDFLDKLYNLETKLSGKYSDLMQKIFAIRENALRIDQFFLSKHGY